MLFGTVFQKSLLFRYKCGKNLNLHTEIMEKLRLEVRLNIGCGKEVKKI